MVTIDKRQEAFTRRGFIGSAAIAGLGMTGAHRLLAGLTSIDTSIERAANGSVQLRVGNNGQLDTLNPVTTTSNGQVHALVYDKLLTYDAQLKTVLSLAKSRKVSADGKTLTYTIHEGATFHDGTPVTSADVKFSYDLVHDSGLGNAALYTRKLASTEAPDPSTFIAKFSAPPADDPAVLVFILPKHIWGAIPSDQIAKYPNNEMIGSGPFKFSAWHRDASLEFKRNQEYWGPHPGIDSIQWIVYRNEPTEALGLKQNAIDAVGQISSGTFTSLEKAPKVKAVTSVGEYAVYIGINVWDSPKSKGNPLLREKVIRQAMAYAIDREKLVQLTLQGRGTAGSTLIFPAFQEWHLSLPKSQLYNYDPERAKSILEKAGYRKHPGSSVRKAPNGKPLEFRLWAATSLPVLPAAGELIQQMVEKVGIRFDLSTMSSPTLAGNVYGHADYDCSVWDVGSPPNPSFVLGLQTTSAIGTTSDSYYSNATFDKLVAEQSTELNLKRRQQLVYQAQKLFYDDLPYIVLMYPDALEAHRTDTLSGWRHMPGGIFLNWSTAGYLSLKPLKGSQR